MNHNQNGTPTQRATTKASRQGAAHHRPQPKMELPEQLLLSKAQALIFQLTGLKPIQRDLIRDMAAVNLIPRSTKRRIPTKAVLDYAGLLNTTRQRGHQ